MSIEQRYSTQSILDYVVGIVIFGLTLLIFWFSPVHQVTDSHYSMLLSEGLLKHRSFALDQFNLPRLEQSASTRDYYVMNGNIWQLEIAGGHIYYYFPPGSSLLSLPYVAVANALGISAANTDGSYNPRGEARIETGLAAILMALLAAIFYFTGRLILSRTWSLVIAFAGALGTQVWSTASRGLWSHTWATLLSGLIVWILLADETGRRKINPVVLASLLSWLYFVRPNGSVVVAAVTVFILLIHRELLARLVISGALWLAAFVAYSWVHFGKVLPSYYQANRLRLDLFPVAAVGNLFSPARGLIVYVPAILFVIYLVGRYWKYLPSTRLVWLSLSICILHVLFVSAFANLWGDWWGGASFGPRYTTELVPWFVLLAILGLKAAAVAQADSVRYRRIEVFAGALLLASSIFINARGATSLDTWKWSQPPTDRQLRSQLWDWRHPQFLAGLQYPAPPVEAPLVAAPLRIDFTSPDAGRYLWYGWSPAEKDFRWTDGREASIVFSLNEISDLILEMKLGPFLSNPNLREQRVVLKLNQQPLEALTLTDDQIKNYSVKLPKTLLASRNVLTFEFPDAASPASLGVGSDDRLLGIRVEWMQLRAPE